jgi:hypothetical protein
MILKQAIEKAKSGGWIEPTPYEFDGIKMVNYSEVALDPTFWQALSKALEWPKISAYPRESDNEHETWRMTAHTFYDLILTGGDTEKFWEELIPSRPSQTD